VQRLRLRRGQCVHRLEKNPRIEGHAENYDHGAMSRAAENLGDFGDDLNHFSIQGHARVASIVWKALQRQGLMPAT
jgi:hypothetical protein